MNEIIKQLAEPLSKESIQKTKGSETRKGYDTIGFGYQAVVDQFNNVLGEEWGYSYQVLKESEGTYKSGAPFFEITVQVDIWVKNKENIRSCVGGHTSMNYTDALKGAITNGFKKTAAFWGVGREAFAGELDEDNKPLPDHNHNKAESKSIETLEQEANEKLSSLSDYIKNGFKVLNFTKKKVWELCDMYEWDQDKIKEHLDMMTTGKKGN